MELLELLLKGEYKEFIKLVKEAKKKFSPPYEDVAKQYDVAEHAVNDEVLRPNKQIERPNTNKDGTPKLDGNNQQTFTTATEFVARVAMPYQKIIVKRRVGFLLGNPVEYYLEDFPSDAESVVYKAFDVIKKDNKLEYQDRYIANYLFSEREVAEIWYLQEDAEFWGNKEFTVTKKLSTPARLKMTIISPSQGDELYPVFDEFQDMLAFMRLFEGVVDGKVKDMATIYTPNFIYKLYSDGGEWKEIPEGGKIANSIGKVPVIYYRQDNAEWYDVQSMIERREEVASNLGDENDYFGQPILFAKGNISGFSEKKDSGKVLEGQGADTDVKFISWEHAPASIELEITELDGGIYKFTQTPDISFENTKGIGNLTGIALKLMFTDPQMAARTKESIVGEGFQRRTNLIKSTIGMVLDKSLEKEAKQITIKPVFTPFLPEDLETDIGYLSEAYQSGILSQKTAVERNPLVGDPVGELEQINSEQSAGESLTV